MSNPVDILVERIKNRTINIYSQLEGANLAGANFEGVNLQGANFNRANLEGANFANTELEDVFLNYANLKGANLQNAKIVSGELLYVDLRGADLRGADFIHSYLNFANLEGVDATDCFFTNVEMKQANFNNATLVKCEFTGENDSERTNLSKSTFINANLESSTFYTVNLNKTNLTNANLQKSYMYDTFLMNANLSGVNMSHMYFDRSSVNVRGTDLANVIGYNTVFDNDEDYNNFMYEDENSNNDLEQQEQVNRFVQEIQRQYFNEIAQNNRPAIQQYTGSPINLNLEIVDIYDLTYDDTNNKIPGTDNVNGFLNQDQNNIVFLFQNNLFFTNKTYISKTLHDGTFIKFGCTNADGTLNPNNIIRDKPYIPLKQVGLYGGLITMIQAIGLLTGNRRFFRVGKTDQTLESTVSFAVLNGGNRVSASHCQEGQGDIVYNLEYIDLPLGTPMEVTGVKKSSRKYRKERNIVKKTNKRKNKKQNRQSRKVRKS